MSSGYPDRPGGSTAAAPLVLPHKLGPTRLPVAVMRRARLWGALTDPRARVVLMSAPAGYGKSVLVGDWVTTLPRAQWAWLGLDSGDDDPVRFWMHLIHAVARAGQPLNDRVAAAVQESEGDPHVCAALFAEELGACLELRVLVLEDVHSVTSAMVRAGLTLLVELSPPSVRVVIITRQDPQLPVHRWRLRGDLRELRELDLRFETDEARRVIETHGVALGPDEVDSLVSLTEGWPAAMQLAALHLQSEADVGALLSRSQRAHQPVLDFLSGEVLDGLPVATRAALREAAMLEPFCAELLDAVCDGVDGSEFIRELRLRNLFIVSLDEPSGWYRFHHLFGEYLRNELRHADRAAELRLRSRAGKWCAQAGYPEWAIEHLLAAHEFEAALEVVGPSLFPFYEAGRLRTIDRWRAGFPDEFVAAAPDRMVVAALMCLLTAAPTDADRWWRRLTATGRSPSADAQWQAALVWIALNLLMGRFRAVTSGDVDAIEAGAAWFPAVAARARGVVARAHMMLGESDQAHAAVSAMVGHSLADAWTVGVVGPGILSLVAFEQGLLADAEELASTARDHDEVAGRESHFDTLDYKATLAGLALERESFDEAAARAHTVVESARRLALAPHLIVATHVAVYAALATDEVDAAQSEVDEARRFLRGIGMPPDLQTRLAETEVAVLVRIGELDRAARVAAEARPIRRDHLLGRIDLHRRDFEAVAARLGGGPDVRWSLRNQLDHLVLLAAACSHLDTQVAADHLEAALTLAEPHGYRHSILSVDASIAELLVSTIGRLHSDYAAGLAGVRAPAIARSAHRPARGPHLTPAEERVVYYLPSGLDTAELARHLGVSKNTVKSQLKSVYRKLGVTSRADAAERARELGIR